MIDITVTGGDTPRSTLTAKSAAIIAVSIQGGYKVTVHGDADPSEILTGMVGAAASIIKIMGNNNPRACINIASEFIKRLMNFVADPGFNASCEKPDKEEKKSDIVQWNE